MLPSGEGLGLVGRAQAMAATSTPALMARLRRAVCPTSCNVRASIHPSKYVTGERVRVNAEVKMHPILDGLPDHVYGVLASRIGALLPQRPEVGLYKRRHWPRGPMFGIRTASAPVTKLGPVIPPEKITVIAAQARAVGPHGAIHARRVGGRFRCCVPRLALLDRAIRIVDLGPGPAAHDDAHRVAFGRRTLSYPAVSEDPERHASRRRSRTDRGVVAARLQLPGGDLVAKTWWGPSISEAVDTALGLGIPTQREPKRAGRDLTQVGSNPATADHFDVCQRQHVGPIPLGREAKHQMTRSREREQPNRVGERASDQRARDDNDGHQQRATAPNHSEIYTTESDARVVALLGAGRVAGPASARQNPAAPPSRSTPAAA